MAVAVHTGIPAREWLRDPAALGTAVEILNDLAERANAKG